MQQNQRQEKKKKMGRNPCCAKVGLNRGAWTAQEDKILTDYLKNHGEGKWTNIPKEAGLKRCGKSCRLRWLNYLRPDIKRGNISPDEEDLIIRLHKLLGNRWSLIAGRLPGRTDNEIKNYWNTNLSGKQKDTDNKKPTPPPTQSKNEKKKPPRFKLAKPSSAESSEVVKVRASRYNGMPLTKKTSQPEDDDDHIAKISSPDSIIVIPAADDSISKMTQTAEDSQSLSDFSVDFDMGEIILDHYFHQMGGDFDLGDFNYHKVVAYENPGFQNVNENNTGGSTFHDDELNMVCGMESFNGSSGHFDHHGDQTYAELQRLASFLGSSSSVEEWLGNDF